MVSNYSGSYMAVSIVLIYGLVLYGHLTHMFQMLVRLLSEVAI